MEAQISINKNCYTSIVAEEDHSKNDCLLVFVMTHGHEGTLEAYDGDYNEEVLWESFTGSNSPTLAGKPKLFFIQACRGNKFDSGFLRVSDENEAANFCLYTVDANPFKNVIPRLHVESSHWDVLIMHSTQKGFNSFRDSNNGTWFIQELCAVLEKLASSGFQQDIIQVLTKVIRRVGEKVGTLRGFKQTPSITQSLSKQFKLGRKSNLMIQPLPLETPCRGGKA